MTVLRFGICRELITKLLMPSRSGTSPITIGTPVAAISSSMLNPISRKSRRFSSGITPKVNQKRKSTPKTSSGSHWRIRSTAERPNSRGRLKNRKLERSRYTSSSGPSAAASRSFMLSMVLEYCSVSTSTCSTTTPKPAEALAPMIAIRWIGFVSRGADSIASLASCPKQLPNATISRMMRFAAMGMPSPPALSGC
ncbi:MAG: hypothetical protein CBC35_07960 [Planctomycetes bacterium TMED75]|nr:hypothetical protein [Planctomycetaceae bacterium]OUU92131.1 MAG: hypothetical protein CBC35_07960 [Planctomycetes bacterium TMED75]